MKTDVYKIIRNGSHLPQLKESFAFLGFHNKLLLWLVSIHLKLLFPSIQEGNVSLRHNFEVVNKGEFEYRTTLGSYWFSNSKQLHWDFRCKSLEKTCLCYIGLKWIDGMLARLLSSSYCASGVLREIAPINFKNY